MTKDIRISNFIDEVNAFSAGKLKNIDELKVLILLVEEKDKHDEFQELIFFSKFVIKLYRILKKGTPGSEDYNKIKEEFSAHVEKVKELLKILSGSDENCFVLFNKKYFDNTPESFNKFLDLLDDFAWLKNWHIDNKKLW